MCRITPLLMETDLDFFEERKSSYPGYRVILRHIQDMEKRFVTIEEFMHRRR